MKKKIRYCPDCGFRELDKWQKKCAECRTASVQYNMSVAYHTYSNSEKGKETIRKCQREYHRKRYNEDAGYRELHKRRVAESARKRREQKKQLRLFK